MCTHGGAVAADAMRTFSSIMRLLVALPPRGFNVFAEAHGHHGYASSSRLVDMCNWCGCSITRQGAGTAGIAQHQNPAKLRTVLALLSHAVICHTAWHLIQRCWRRAVALGRVVPPRRAIAASRRARGGEVRNVALYVHKVLESLS
jgi:hypothetical protein